MSEIFVIRGYHWGYNDETFYPCGNYIKSTFASEAEAKKTLVALERGHWQQMDLGETNQFFDTDQPLIDRVNAFITQKCGKPLFTNDDRRDVFVPNELNDEDFTEFLRIAGLQAYKLTKFEDGQKFYAIWFPDEEDYLKEYDECTTALVYEESVEQLKKSAADQLEYHWDDGIKIKGELDQISDTPELLKNLIGSQKGIKYNEQKKKLKINPERVDALFAVNELLKAPLFEIRELTIDEVTQMESELSEEWC